LDISCIRVSTPPAGRERAAAAPPSEHDLTLRLGLALTDAAFAFRSHAAAIRTASILLFCCVAADLIAAGLVITTAFRMPPQK